ncbi:MAG: hypothetical protein MZV64_23740 [Ignavibacteriales bacterium]|nr:hypothetical protein [Ignavibacteriales bacterium]
MAMAKDGRAQGRMTSLRVQGHRDRRRAGPRRPAGSGHCSAIGGSST